MQHQARIHRRQLVARLLADRGDMLLVPKPTGECQGGRRPFLSLGKFAPVQCRPRQSLGQVQSKAERTSTLYPAVTARC